MIALSATTRSDPLESALRNDRRIVLAALLGIAAVAWAYLIYEARAMQRTGVCECLGLAMSGPDTKPWAATAILPLFLMWSEMMVAMMIPSAAPMILTFARVNRQRRENARPLTRGWFTSIASPRARGNWISTDPSV